MRTVPPPAPSPSDAPGSVEAISGQSSSSFRSAPRTAVSRVALEWVLVDPGDGVIQVHQIGIPTVIGPHFGDLRIMRALRTLHARFEAEALG